MSADIQKLLCLEFVFVLQMHASATLSSKKNDEFFFNHLHPKVV
jgi:hypothetical protein